MIRVEALRQERFNPILVAREEPELCLRLGRRGWKIARLDAEMTWHDANLMRFGAWWRRTVRNAHRLCTKCPTARPRSRAILRARGARFSVVGLGVAGGDPRAGGGGIGVASGVVGVVRVRGVSVLAWRVYRHQREARVEPGAARILCDADGGGEIRLRGRHDQIPPRSAFRGGGT